jgi:hypothetical protein
MNTSVSTCKLKIFFGGLKKIGIAILFRIQIQLGQRIRISIQAGQDCRPKKEKNLKILSMNNLNVL